MHFIINAIREGVNIDLAIFKMGQLEKLSEIFEEFEDTYTKKFEEMFDMDFDLDYDISKIDSAPKAKEISQLLKPDQPQSAKRNAKHHDGDRLDDESPDLNLDLFHRQLWTISPSQHHLF